jgi:transmembrane sensor
MNIDHNLIIKYLSNRYDAVEKEAVNAWINTSEKNRKDYEDIKKIWEAAEAAPDTIQPDFDKAWKNIKAQTGIREPNERRLTIGNHMNLLRVAAALIILIGTGIILKKVYFEKPVMNIEASLNNSKKKIQLADGTTIFLNRNSKLTFPKKFNHNAREVFLEGEAFFKVARDTSHPFIVHASVTVVRVLGTSFNIKATDSVHIFVSVLTGKVAFTAKNKPSESIHLEKGDQGSYETTTQHMNKTHYNDENFLAWKTGIIRFNNQTLGNAVKVLSGYYSKTIEAEPSLQNRLITVSFDNQPLNEVLEIMKLTLNITIQNDSDKITLKAQRE